MAIVADYLVIARAGFALQIGASGPTPRAEMSFNFSFPAGVVFNKSNPLIQYQMQFISPPRGNQMGLAIQINGIEVQHKLFLASERSVFVQAIAGDDVTGAPFNATGVNTMRFLPMSPTNDTTSKIYFGGVVLWFQRDSTNQG